MIKRCLVIYITFFYLLRVISAFAQVTALSDLERKQQFINCLKAAAHAETNLFVRYEQFINTFVGLGDYKYMQEFLLGPWRSVTGEKGLINKNISSFQVIKKCQKLYGLPCLKINYRSDDFYLQIAWDAKNQINEPIIENIDGLRQLRLPANYKNREIANILHRYLSASNLHPAVKNKTVVAESQQTLGKHSIRFKEMQKNAINAITRVLDNVVPGNSTRPLSRQLIVAPTGLGKSFIALETLKEMAIRSSHNAKNIIIFASPTKRLTRENSEKVIEYFDLPDIKNALQSFVKTQDDPIRITTWSGGGLKVPEIMFQDVTNTNKKPLIIVGSFQSIRSRMSQSTLKIFDSIRDKESILKLLNGFPDTEIVLNLSKKRDSDLFRDFQKSHVPQEIKSLVRKSKDGKKVYMPYLWEKGSNSIGVIKSKTYKLQKSWTNTDRNQIFKFLRKGWHQRQVIDISSEMYKTMEKKGIIAELEKKGFIEYEADRVYIPFTIEGNQVNIRISAYHADQFMIRKLNGVVVDEAHFIDQPKIKEAIVDIQDNLQAKFPIIGLTASPLPTESTKHMYPHQFWVGRQNVNLADPLKPSINRIVQPTVVVLDQVSNVIQEGQLANFTHQYLPNNIWTPSGNISITKVKKLFSELHDKNIMEERKGFITVRTKKDTEKLSAELNEMFNGKYSFFAVHSDVKGVDNIIDAMKLNRHVEKDSNGFWKMLGPGEKSEKSRSVDFMIAVDKLNEGIDIPEMSLWIDLNKNVSSTKLIQRLGRILRLHPGKKEPLFISISDVSLAKAGQQLMAKERNVLGELPTNINIRSFGPLKLSELEKQTNSSFFSSPEVRLVNRLSIYLEVVTRERSSLGRGIRLSDLNMDNHIEREVYKNILTILLAPKEKKIQIIDHLAHEPRRMLLEHFSLIKDTDEYYSLLKQDKKSINQKIESIIYEDIENYEQKVVKLLGPINQYSVYQANLLDKFVAINKRLPLEDTNNLKEKSMSELILSLKNPSTNKIDSEIWKILDEKTRFLLDERSLRPLEESINFVDNFNQKISRAEFRTGENIKSLYKEFVKNMGRLPRLGASDFSYRTHFNVNEAVLHNQMKKLLRSKELGLWDFNTQTWELIRIEYMQEKSAWRKFLSQLVVDYRNEIRWFKQKYGFLPRSSASNGTYEKSLYKMTQFAQHEIERINLSKAHFPDGYTNDSGMVFSLKSITQIQ